MQKWTFLTLALALIVAGCFEGKSYITSDKSNKVAKYLSDKPPEKMDVELGTPLGDKLVLLGYDIDKPQAKAGDKVTVKWYWKCIKATGPGWRLMTHVFDHTGSTRLNADEKGAIRKYFQPEHWKPGLYITDVQKLTIPKNWSYKTFHMRTGVWKGETRLRASGQHADSGGRVKGPKIRTTPARITRRPRYIPKATEAPVIDGNIESDPAWKNVDSLEEFLDTQTGFDVKGKTDVKLLWDEKNLYIAVAAKDDFLKSPYKNHDDTLWKADAFELFLDPRGDQKNYYEIQVNPAGIVFDSRLPKHRKNQNEWSSNLVVKTTQAGTLNDDSGDQGWTAELMIPFSAFESEPGVPPTVNTEWTANFFRVDAGKGKTRYSAWSPPLVGDFHALDRFGRIFFVEKAEKTDTGAARMPTPAGNKSKGSR